MKAIGTQSRDPINSGTDPMAVDGIDGRRHRHLLSIRHSLYRRKRDKGEARE